MALGVARALRRSATTLPGTLPFEADGVGTARCLHHYLQRAASGESRHLARLPLTGVAENLRDITT